MSFNILGFAIELDLVFYANIAIKIIVACVLGGLIGYERETLNRPAGLRTHILVCVGATIAMIVNLDLVSQYDGIANVNPGRFGASVISGIGFLGAGTIIKEGVSVKELEQFARKYTNEAFLVFAIVIASLSSMPRAFISLPRNIFSNTLRLLTRLNSCGIMVIPSALASTGELIWTDSPSMAIEPEVGV